jgi:hypothetical protein
METYVSPREFKNLLAIAVFEFFGSVEVFNPPLAS